MYYRNRKNNQESGVFRMAKKKLKTKIKSNTELMKSIRRQWHINPITRIKEDDSKNTTKIRQANKKDIQNSEE